MKISFTRKAYCLIGFLCFSTCFFYGQNQKLTDSLINLYQSGSYQDNELDLLKNIMQNESDPKRGLEFADLLIEKAAIDSSFDLLHSGYLEKGNFLTRIGENSEALEAYFKSLNYAKRINDQTGIGSLMIAIAGSYTSMEDTKNAIRYFKSGIQLLRAVNDSIKIATSLLNIGDLYISIGKLDSALIYTSESVLLFNKVNYPIGSAYGMGNSGMIYAEQGYDDIAENNINEAIKILEELEDYYPISVYLTYMSDIYLRKNDYTMALNYAQRSLELAQKYDLKEQISDANLKLAQLYEQQGDQVTSYKYYKDHISYRDSVNNIETVQQMADLRTNYEVSQKQIEVDLLDEKQRNQRITLIATVVGLGLIMILALGLFRRNRFIKKTSDVIQQERDRSDQLLLNILPEETAKELKDKGKVKAKRFESVSVLFTDFKGFTEYSANLSPEELVESVNYYYSKFDEIMEKHGLEKIKTVGDAYMAAGGLPFPSADHALKMVEAALEIRDFVKESKKTDPDDQTRFDIRIGINTGPVVAGVVGTKKFAYDIWGDTVNIASRMESNSEPGKINVSENTYQLIKDQFTCMYRGEIEAKNKGKLKMYFVGEAIS